MSLFPSTLTGRIFDDGETPPPVIELQGISAGQLATVLTAYTPLETTTANTADIGTNAAAIAALQGQVAALPPAPELAPYAYEMTREAQTQILGNNIIAKSLRHGFALCMLPRFWGCEMFAKSLRHLCVIFAFFLLPKFWAANRLGRNVCEMFAKSLRYLCVVFYNIVKHCGILRKSL